MEPEGTTTWTWGAASDNTPSAKYIGRLKSIASPGGYSETNSNDSLGRIVQQDVVIDGTTYPINRTYSAATGLPATLQYPTSTSGYRLALAYDYQNGYLKRLRNSAAGTVYWEAVSTNPWGRLQDETFVYDPLNRLDYSQRNGVTNLDVTLDAIGNVSWKSDVGSFSYHATKRRAVVSAGSNSYGYDANGNMVTRNGSTIAYASYNLPTSIAAGANSNN